MPTTPYKEETTRPGGTGHLDPPKGITCAWLQRHSFGNAITYEQVCRGGEVIFIRTELTTRVVAAAGGGCDTETTAQITTIHTGRPCDGATFKPMPNNEAYERFVKLAGEIAAREKKEKKDNP
jgi:hypothetical protein